MRNFFIFVFSARFLPKKIKFVGYTVHNFLKFGNNDFTGVKNTQNLDYGKKVKNKYQGNETRFSDFPSASITECTGLIPSAPDDDSEYEAYAEIYGYGPKTPQKNK